MTQEQDDSLMEEQLQASITSMLLINLNNVGRQLDAVNAENSNLRADPEELVQFKIDIDIARNKIAAMISNDETHIDLETIQYITNTIASIRRGITHDMPSEMVANVSSAFGELNDAMDLSE